MTEDVTIQGRDQEAALIGSILRKPAILDEMQETIKPDHFQYIPYRNVWEAMVELRTREMGIDTITVGDELERRGCLNNWSLHDKASSSGRVALTFLRELGQPINAKSYADNIIDYAAKRAAFQIINKAANWLQSGRRAGDILQDIEKQLSEIATTDSKASKHTMTISEAVTSAYLVTDSASQGNKNYIETGYKDIDNLITGLCAPDFTLVAARPGQGKTAFLASVIHNIINIYSPEIGKSLLLGKLIINFTVVNPQIGPLHLSKFHKIIHNFPDNVYRYCKGITGIISCT